MSQYFEDAKMFVTTNVSKLLESKHVSTVVDKFKALPKWQQVLVSGGIVIGSSVTYLVTSYHVCNALYGREPFIDAEIYGDIKNNNGIIIAIHGWPDCNDMWDLQIKYLTDKGYCMICLELPNFNMDKPIQNPWGYSMSSVLNGLGIKMYSILNENNLLNNKNNYILAHDWGALFAENIYINYKNSISFNKMILLDVGDGVDDNPKYQYKTGYQMVNAMSFVLPRFLGTFFINFYYKNIRLTKGFLNKGGFPALTKEKLNNNNNNNKKYFTSVSAYLYFYLVKALLTNDVKELSKLLFAERGDMNEFDDIPICFIDANKGWGYDEDIAPRYYSSKWEKYIKSKDFNVFERWDCYHWIASANVGLPNKLNEKIIEFIQN